LSFLFKALLSFIYRQTYLQLFNLPLLAAARLPQIWANYKAKSTGQLSFISSFLSFGGALARMFTTIQDVSKRSSIDCIPDCFFSKIGWDFALLSSYLVAATINGVIVCQVFPFFLYTLNSS
jgi:hypothetical protein